jgi:hypothetical protein
MYTVSFKSPNGTWFSCREPFTQDQLPLVEYNLMRLAFEMRIVGHYRISRIKE